MNALQLWLDRATAVVWGGPTVVVLLATGAYLSFVLRGVQLRRLVHGLRVGLLVRDETGAEGDISHFQALMLALGGSIGIGSLLGVAGAVAAGGPGSLFWLWITGWLVMATRYAEAMLSIHYREPDRQGRMSGGPMYYLSLGVGGAFGRFLAAVFAVFAVIAALGVGSAVPGQAAAEALRSSLSVPPLVTGLVLAGAVGAVLAGGVRAIGRTVGVVVPVLVVGYLVTGVVVLALHADRIDDAIVAVFQDAFTGEAAAGGVFGASIREAVRWGVSHGTLSAGTGFGTGGIAASAARTRTATTQAVVAMTQTFIDTIVVSGVTGLAVVVTGVHGGMDPTVGGAYVGVPVTTAALPSGLPVGFGGAIVALGLACFAFTTVLAWAYYGERSAEYLFGVRATTPFRVLLVVAVLAGGVLLQVGADGFHLFWSLSHVVSGGMAVPSLVGLLLLSGVAVRETTRSPETR